MNSQANPYKSRNRQIVGTTLATVAALALTSCHPDTAPAQAPAATATQSPAPSTGPTLTRKKPEVTGSTLKEREESVAKWIAGSSDCELTSVEPFTDKIVRQPGGVRRDILGIKFVQKGDYLPSTSISAADFTTIQHKDVDTSTDSLERRGGFGFYMPGNIDSKTIKMTPTPDELNMTMISDYGIPVRFLGNTATIRVYAGMDVTMNDWKADSSQKFTADQYCGEFNVTLDGPHIIDVSTPPHKRDGVAEVVTFDSE